MVFNGIQWYSMVFEWHFFVRTFRQTVDICGWTADQCALKLEIALVGEAYRLMINNVHPKDYRSLRAVLLRQYNQFGSGVALRLRRFRHRTRGATERLRVVVNELHNLARQAYPNCDIKSRLSLVKEQFTGTLTDNLPQRLFYIESDAPLERLVHIVEKSEQFNECTVVKLDNGGILLQHRVAMRRVLVTHLPATMLTWTR